jgi:2,4'-dihydroxyacetophenone dioxygenase
MTATMIPGVANTQAGAPLPLVALPQDQILTVNINDIPLIKDTPLPGIHVQTIRLDPQRNELVLMVTMAPGVELPMHYHTGTAEVYTLSGRWEYREYPDQPQVAGSYLFEPAGTTHTFFVPEDNTEDTVVLWWMQGAQVSFNDDGTFHSLTDAVTVQYLTETASVEQGTGPIPYIRGGASEMDTP